MKKWIRITAIFSTLLLMLVGNSYVLNAKSIENDDVSITITVAQDQDYLNVICKNRVTYLDNEWN